MTRTELLAAYAAGRRDFTRLNLRGDDLSEADLSGANLRGADLSEADLSWAVLSGADLSEADLSWAVLSGADLSGANLSGANLRGADLSGANLSGASLSGANLRGADLSEANLSGAVLSGAVLSGADLSEAVVNNVKWPAPETVLLAQWGTVGEDLCRELMRYDAAYHPDPARFDVWATGGACPYADIPVKRVAHFQESRALYSDGPSLSAEALAAWVIAEKCVLLPA